MSAELSREEKRAKIAEACGWSIHQIKVSGLDDVAILPPGVSIDEDGSVWKYAGIDLPDYFGSLDAMHEAEKALPNIKLEEYYRRLLGIVTGPKLATLIDGCVWHATAEQRCEAFGKTLGLWT